MEDRPQATRHNLAQRELIALVDTRGFVVECVFGALWITADGVAGDHLLQAGEQISFPGHAQVVISALAPSVIRSRPCCGNHPVRLLAARCAAAMFDRIRRWQHLPLAAYPVTRLR